MRRVLTRVVTVVMLLGLVSLGAGGWYYSDEVLPAPAPDPPSFDVAVSSADPERNEVRLATDDPDLLHLDTVGLQTADGLVVLRGEGQQVAGGTVRRGTLVEGTWPAPGDQVAVSVDTFAGDPASALGLPHDDVDVHAPLGVFPAWRVVPPRPDPGGTWVVIVHGRGAARSEGNRLLPTLDDLGLPSLTVSMRNDPGVPADPDGFGYYGAREWQELEAAVTRLRDVESARQVVLVGYSQGASVVLSFLRTSPLADEAVAAVLISPLISLDATLELHARRRDIPGPLIRPLLLSTGLATRLRADLDLGEIEHLDHLGQLPPELPMLVTHGDADAMVPVEPTRSFARRLGEAVTYEEYAGVDHVREWNSDPMRFETDLREFLAQHAVASAD